MNEETARLIELLALLDELNNKEAMAESLQPRLPVYTALEYGKTVAGVTLLSLLWSAAFKTVPDPAGGDVTPAMGKISGAIAELERNFIKERVRAGMRRAKLDGVRLGRKPLQADRQAIIRDRQSGRSLTEIARAHSIARGSVSKVLKAAGLTSHKEVIPATPQTLESTAPESAA